MKARSGLWVFFVLQIACTNKSTVLIPGPQGGGGYTGGMGGGGAGGGGRAGGGGLGGAGGIGGTGGLGGIGGGTGASGGVGGSSPSLKDGGSDDGSGEAGTPATDTAPRDGDSLFCPGLPLGPYVSIANQPCGAGAPACRWRLVFAADGTLSWSHDGVTESGTFWCVDQVTIVCDLTTQAFTASYDPTTGQLAWDPVGTQVVFVRE